GLLAGLEFLIGLPCRGNYQFMPSTAGGHARASAARAGVTRACGARAEVTCACASRAGITRASAARACAARAGVTRACLALVFPARLRFIRGRGRPRSGSPTRPHGGSPAPSHVPLVSIGIDGGPDGDRHLCFT
ncbi:MAG: hypothetical protein ACLP5E_27075, partial [Streptosporangiaceae bacterium]